MLKRRFNRNGLFAATMLALCVSLAPLRAHAVSKETVQMQTQIQQLLDMVQRLQTTMDTRFAVLQNLAQQTADQATQMNGTVTALQQKLNTQIDWPERKARHQFRTGAIAERLRRRVEDAHCEAGKVDSGFAKPVAERADPSKVRRACRGELPQLRFQGVPDRER